VLAFDPVYDHLEILTHNIKQNPDCNVRVVPFGLANFDANYQPIKLETYAPGFSALVQNCPLRRLDTFVVESNLSKIDYIKMDIEGSELSALTGATDSINAFRPKLAISLYHKPNDLYEIPLYISKEFPFYKMYIEHYSIHNEETVLYCSSE